jgi:LPXTG-motif cell wall-anchored protein
MAGIANAGLDGGELPEPTAMLVWLGLAGAGGLFFWRRNRDDV